LVSALCFLSPEMPLYGPCGDGSYRGRTV